MNIEVSSEGLNWVRSTTWLLAISGNTSVMSKRNDRLTLISLLDSTGFLCQVVVAGVVVFVVLSPT